MNCHDVAEVEELEVLNLNTNPDIWDIYSYGYR